MSRKWPVWIRVTYYDQNTGGILGYTGAMNNSESLMEVIYRLRLTEPNVIRWMVNDQLLDDDGIKKMFALYEQHREEIEEKYEKRETSNKKTEGSSPDIQPEST